MTAIAATAAPARSRPRGFRRLLSTELKLFAREPMLLFWGLLFPVGLLVVLGIAGGDKPQHSLGNVKLIVAYTPVVMMFTVTILAAQRAAGRAGVLPRQGVPAPAVDDTHRSRPAAGRAGHPQLRARRCGGDPGGAGEPLRVLGGAAPADRRLCPGDGSDPGGDALARHARGRAWRPTQRIAAAIGSLLFFPLMFFAGLWVPQAAMGTGLRDVSHYSPLGAAVPAVQNAIAGHWPGTVHLLVLAGVRRGAVRARG